MAEFALIGSRDIARLSQEKRIPSQAINYFRRAAKLIVENGHLIRTGGAAGVDQLAIKLALQNKGNIEVFLPTETFEKQWFDKIGFSEFLTVTVFDSTIFPEAAASVKKYHPAYDNINKSAHAAFIKRAHARNALVIGGFDGIPPVRAVIAISDPLKPLGGGTGQSIRLAKYLDIPVFDLAYAEDMKSLTKAINEDGLFEEKYQKKSYRTNLRCVDPSSLASWAQKTISQEYPFFEKHFLGQGSNRMEEYELWLQNMPVEKRIRFENLWNIIFEEKKAAPVGFSTWSKWIQKLKIKVIS